MLVVATAAVAVATPLFAGGSMDLPTLTAALRSQLSSIASIDVKYRRVFHDPHGSQQIADVEWAEQGEWRSITRFGRQPERKPYSLMFDGAKGYQYTWDPVGAEPARLTLSKAIDPGYWNATTPAYFIGWRVKPGETTLPELMALPDTELVGAETYEGRDCWRIEIKSFGPDKFRRRLSVLLDGAHDFLPAVITERFADDGHEHPDQPRRKDYYSTWTNNEFMQVKDEVSGMQRWFPRRMTLDQMLGSKHTLTVTSVALNQTLPLERFQPNVPDGTFVSDKDAPGGEKFVIQG
ncbi:MAG: hypothetical protein B7Z73_06980, partial [Planctomycetia bacterium 21-64-5]